MTGVQTCALPIWRIQGSSSLRFPFASVWMVMKKNDDDDDGDDRSGDGAGAKAG